MVLAGIALAIWGIVRGGASRLVGLIALPVGLALIVPALIAAFAIGYPWFHSTSSIVCPSLS